MSRTRRIKSESIGRLLFPIVAILGTLLLVLALDETGIPTNGFMQLLHPPFSIFLIILCQLVVADVMLDKFRGAGKPILAILVGTPVGMLFSLLFVLSVG